jgi:glycosyltransferase involved in cell wall biosynthesis
MSALERLAGRRVLFLNWRDLANPAAGGAEAYSEQIARRFAGAGCHLTILTSEYENAPPYDWANGYLVARNGGRFGVYLAAAWHLRHYGKSYDAVVDFQNGIPFFAPLWAPAQLPVVCVVHHVHQAQFDLYFRWPLNRLGRLLEGRVSRWVYRGRPFVAVSPSTRAEMRQQLAVRGPISIVPNGIDPGPPADREASPGPGIAVVTRLVPHKQLHLLVDAVPELLRRWPDLRVVIAGDGPEREALLTRAHRLGVHRAVSLPGHVSDHAKRDLLSRAWLTVAPSVAEGWGLTVLEANAMGTPALAYDVPGLRDSVRHKVTGWLIPAGQALAGPLISALGELADPGTRCRMAGQARQWARRFSWDATAERIARVLVSEAARIHQGSPSRRAPIDLATIAFWAPSRPNDDLARSLRKTLRVTDIVSNGPAGLHVLLTGCDEFGAVKALRRVPVQPDRLRLATGAQLLCGASEASWHAGA